MATLLFHEGFETGNWTHNCRVFPVGGDPYNTEIGNIFTPEDWVCFFKHRSGIWDQPEAHNTWKSVDPRRIHSGEGAYMLFSFYRKHDAGIMRYVAAIEGETLKLTAWAHAWSNTNLPGHSDCLDDGRCSCGVDRQVIAIKDPPPLNGDPWNDAISNFSVMVGIDPFGGDDPYAASVVWGDAYYIYNGFARELSVETVAQADTITVFVRSITMYPFKHNDLYIDDVSLEESGSTPPSYESIMLVLPQDATPEQLQEIFTLAYPNRRTFGFSHDDAGHLNGTAILYNIPNDEKSAYLDFYTTRYSNVTVKFEYTSDWEEPDDILLWQCDSRWKHRNFAESCNTCNLGCWITACAMAQRYYDIDKDATPITVDELLKSVGGYSGCNTTWTGMKAVLGIEVVKKTTDIDEARQWLEGGNICFAEVLPTSLQHFVMVDTPDWHMYDPYKNKSCNLHDLYEGAESWRLIRQVQSPTPLTGSPIGLHLQSMVEGALEYIARVKPRAVKIFQLENAEAIKAASPDTLVVLRKFTGNQDVSGDLKKAAKNYINTFKDSLIINSPWIDYVESYNELIATHDIEGIKRSVEFDCHFADELMALGLPVAPLLLTAAVGNPYHKDGEIELMLPAVRKAIQYNGVLGYHAYWYANPNEGGPDADWKYFAGRWTEWDKIFNAHELYPRYIFGESGAVGAIRHPDASLQLLPCDGWRSNMCCEGDWNRYKQQLHRMAELIDEWNTTHNNRAIGYTIFTTGGWDWESFEFLKQQMESI
jgi:hypothetical protein